MNPIDKRRRLSSIFTSFFENQGYTIEDPVSLLANNDDTLLFINDTIAPWKRYIEEKNIPEEGLCLEQTCLRLQGTRDSINDINILEKQSERFLGVFNAIGILTSKNKIAELSSDISSLMFNEYKISKNKLKIFARPDMDYISLLQKQLPVTFENHPDIHYEWNYGISGVKGVGATFMLKQPNDQFKEIGQLIQIRDHSNTILGYEFGFGAEVFTSRLMGDTTYAPWSIHSAVSEDRLQFKTLLDNYSCLGAMLTTNQNQWTNRHYSEHSKVVRNIAKINNLYDISPRLSEKIIKDFVELEFSKNIQNNLENLFEQKQVELYNKANGLRYTNTT